MAAARANAKRVYAGLHDLPEIVFRRRPDPDGELGSAVYLYLDGKAERDHFLTAMKAENVPAQPPTGSVLLPVQAYIEKKRTIHPAWPSFQSARGQSIRYGAACCSRSIDILNRFAGVPLDPKYSEEDTNDIVSAIRKTHTRGTAK